MDSFVDCYEAYCRGCRTLLTEQNAVELGICNQISESFFVCDPVRSLERECVVGFSTTQYGIDSIQRQVDASDGMVFGIHNQDPSLVI